MNEVQAYRAVYGDLVYCVPHYAYRIRCAKAKENLERPKNPEMREAMTP